MAEATTMSKEMTMSSRIATTSSIRRWLPSLVVLATVATALFATPASATEEIQAFEVVSTDSRVGMHPDFETNFTLQDAGLPETARNMIVNLPQGMFGNPNAVPKCSSSDFAFTRCPALSQVGVITVRGNYEGNQDYLLGTAPVYVVESRSETETTRFAFNVPILNIPINIPFSLRTASDYGLRMTVSQITQQIPVAGFFLKIWGFPAKSEHDEERFASGEAGNPSDCPESFEATCTGPHAAPIPILPLTSNPSVCTGQPMKVTLDVQTYQDPDNLSHAEASYPATTDCEKQTFNPVLNVDVTNHSADSPAGLELQLKAPQFEGFAASPSQIRSATLLLPEGLTINPDAADGQGACSDDDANFDSEGRDECPDISKIGNFDIESPALDGPLTGSLFFGEPKPGNQYRVFMLASGFGINAKIVASVHPDPETGRLTMSVTDLPQVPFDGFNLHVFASDRALTATPTRCAVYTADSVFAPWNNKLASQHSEPFISIDSGPNGGACPGQIRPFEPRLVAGMSNPVAGNFSNFTLRLDRDDGDQFLGDLNFKMPTGLSGYLRGITYCADAAIAAAAERLGRAEQASPSCPSSSEIGTSNVAAGPGSHPFHAVGRMYLAGPFEGAPLSLVAITPALAGPYDYGTVVVRVALHIDERTAQVTAVSDTVPSIIGGVPIRMRSIQVNINKPEFMINPTSCHASFIESQGIGDQGTVTDFSSYFHPVNCYSLGFSPRMAIKQLGGTKQTKRTKNPRLRFDLYTRPGDANLKSISVTLSKAYQIDQRHLFNICSRSQLENERCEGRQPMGRVWVKSPLLDEPLEGPAYAVSGYGKLPHLVFILDGQVMVMPQAESSSVRHGHLKTIVPIIPDAPVGHFRLTLLGGSKGYLINSKDLCRNGGAIKVAYTAQSGRTRNQTIKVKSPCGGQKGTRKRRK
jgi:hypothetical protein